MLVGWGFLKIASRPIYLSRQSPSVRILAQPFARRVIICYTIMFYRIGLLVAAVVALCTGCQRSGTSASPTAASPITASPNTHDTYAWAPCVVVQSPGGVAFNVQMAAAKRLELAGKLRWIRLNTSLDGAGLQYHLEARRLGLNVMSIVHLKDLERAGWEQTFDALQAMYPTDIWEVASEISNPDPAVNPVPITPDYYMQKFKALYDHVRTRYPAAVLANAPPPGSGGAGPAELETFFQQGLLDMNVVVALNVYSNTTLSRYATVIDKYATRLSGKRIWVTETGSANPDNQIAWVQEFYPRVVNSIHPEMICWYAMWGGDGVGSDNGFGLLDQVATGSPIERPLFKALVGSGS